MNKNDKLIKGNIYPKLLIFDGKKAYANEINSQCDACSPTYPIGKSAIQFTNLENNCKFQRVPFIEFTLTNKNFKVLLSKYIRGLVIIDRYSLDLLKKFNDPISISDIDKRKSNLGDNFKLIRKFFQEGLLKFKNQMRVSLHEKNTHLSIWFHLTNRCNHTCNYCFVPKNNMDMSLDVAKNAMQSIFKTAKRNKYSSIHFKYAGGEPLLCYKNIKIMHNIALKLADETGVKIDGKVITNGTLLTAEIMREFVKLNLNLTISLDGFGDNHNIYRIQSIGNNSFKNTMRGVRIAMESNVKPDISITITNKNVDGLSKYLKYLKINGLKFSLNFVKENKPLYLNYHYFTDKNIINSLRNTLNQKCDSGNKTYLINCCLDRLNVCFPHVRPCAAGINYLAIFPDGSVSKCQFDSNRPFSNVRDEDLLKTMWSSEIGLKNPNVELMKGCNSCDFQFWCAGGCPLERTEYIESAQSGKCFIYKSIMPKLIENTAESLLNSLHFNN